MLKYDDKMLKNNSLQPRGKVFSASAKLLSILIFGVLLLGILPMMSADVVSSGTKTYQDIGGVNYTTETFTSNGYFNSTKANLNVSILLVGGGGAGAGGGGGAGGLLWNNGFDVTSGNYVITIGAGGIGTTAGGEYANNGTNTSFGTSLIAWGGEGSPGQDLRATFGGSGGGSSWHSGELFPGGLGVSGQGNNGGTHTNTAPYDSGGGGGAGQVGQDGVAGTSGDGGDGLSYAIYNGTALWYAGGGGGEMYSVPGPGTGGKGGGGDGNSVVGGNGVANTGGGGGGTYNGQTSGDGGSGIIIIRYLTSERETIVSVNLTSPSNNTIISTAGTNFSVNLSMTGTDFDYEWANNTYNIWYSNGTLFNQTFVNGLSTNQTNISQFIGDFVLGNYLWNSYPCYGNTTFSNCTWAVNNYTFTKGSTINSITYSNSTFETKNEQFIINLSLAEGAEVSLAQLIYNGTAYVISNITAVGNNYFLERKIDISANVNGLANQTNEFYVKFTYGGVAGQTFGPYYQNSSFINLVKCDGAYTRQSLNFTLFDEYYQKNINGATNKTTFYSSFKYWLGTGNIYKNYSFQNISSTLNSYQFCIYPYQPENFTFKTNVDIEYYAETYRENKYYLRNSTLTNASSNITLYLLPESIATKFFLTFRKGTGTIGGATVIVQKYFIGTGNYRTVAILLTDDDGKSTMWQEVDKQFKYSVVKDGVLLGTLERVSICSTAPCSLTLIIEEPIETAFNAYNEYYSQNVLSEIRFNKTSKMVYYDFIDITGLANYFRLEVTQAKLNKEGAVICNVFSYSSAGTLSCNLTGYTGDFTAKGYVSRSPELLDKIKGIVFDEDILDKLGITGIFIVMILLITIVIASAVMSRGNPSTVLFMLGISILGLKLVSLFPFSWVVVVTLEVLIIFMIFKIKS